MIRALADCPEANRLKQLTLSGFRVPPHAVRVLVALPNSFSGRGALILESCDLEPEPVRLLRERFGDRVHFTGRGGDGEPIVPRLLTTTPMF
jgi:hypothetical protein